jgi:hypothetical protein
MLMTIAVRRTLTFVVNKGAPEPDESCRDLLPFWSDVWHSYAAGGGGGGGFGGLGGGGFGGFGGGIGQLILKRRETSTRRAD